MSSCGFCFLNSRESTVPEVATFPGSIDSFRYFMTFTASEMGKKSAAVRRKKYGGKEGFIAHMTKVSHARRKLDKEDKSTSNA
jgi:hypothetical protein